MSVRGERTLCSTPMSDEREIPEATSRIKPKGPPTELPRVPPRRVRRARAESTVPTRPQQRTVREARTPCSNADSDGTVSDTDARAQRPRAVTCSPCAAHTFRRSPQDAAAHGECAGDGGVRRAASASPSGDGERSRSWPRPPNSGGRPQSTEPSEATMASYAGACW